MKTRISVIALLLSMSMAGTSVCAKDKWDYSKEGWNSTASYGDVTIAQDSVEQWGPWAQYVEPAAGAPAGTQFVGAPAGEYYRTYYNIPPAPTVSVGFAPVGGTGTIHGQLTWTTTADLDFHMIAPGGGHVAYYNLTVNLPGGSVARLDHDNLGGVIDVAPNLRVENIYVSGTPPVGNYQFYVHSYSGNNGGQPTTGTVTLTGDGGVTGRTYTTTLSNRQVSPTYTVTRTATGTTYSP